ncbi:ECF transporter S component [Brevibacillus dissolubilis]|uniref:ECF transporter S component n=1 Tax=Brevibacillus dissolubilis TaxID=1844116 RepID=UPI00111758FA|nr:ECF transporter S component [Brevibacillus dissolubilis]
MQQTQLQATQINSTRKLVTIPLLAAVAFLLQYLEIQLPLFPYFLKLDFSTVPSLIGGLVFGPAAGILIEFIKNTLHFLLKGAEGLMIGELANFIAGASFVFVTVSIHRWIKGGKGLFTGLVLGTVLMTVIMSVANYYFLMPAYATVYNMPLDQMIQSFGFESLWSLIIVAILPFNIVKGVAASLVAYPVFVKMAPRLRVHV